MMRRRTYRDVQEWWFYAKSKLDLLKKEGKGVESKVERRTNYMVVFLHVSHSG